MWEAIRANRRASFTLLVALGLILCGVGAAIGLSFGALELGLGLAFALWVVVGLMAWFGGNKMVLMASGARAIEKKDAPQLFNVVEEMSLAAGLPMPRVYFIDDTAPNAFATGRKPENAAIAVTKGLLEKMNRDELQGVVAHEMSHIRNRDILYLTLAGVLVGTIVLLCDVYLRYTWFSGGRFRRSSSKGKGKGAGAVHAIILLVAIVLAIIAPLLARLLYLAISRRREYLADASAVELSRYPEGLASALVKISGDKEVLEVANRATAHLYIVNPIKPFEERYSRLSSTHPPVKERIAVLRTMASGGTVADYESARRSLAIGPRRPLINLRKLDAARPAAPGPKPRKGPPRTPEEFKAELERLFGPMGPVGAVFLLCACGSPVLLAGGRTGVIQCAVCGKLHDTRKKEVKARLKRLEAEEAEPEAEAGAREAPLEKAAPPEHAPAADQFGITFEEDGTPRFPPKVDCPYCRREIVMPEGFRGSRGPCPFCRNMIVFFERK